ncbi:MAG: hypothetical protein PHW63_11815, partial [Alphaproteobacteria bacterium]|nr:hypothetical protein [Alphaproteobacteria bacterium]
MDLSYLRDIVDAITPLMSGTGVEKSIAAMSREDVKGVIDHWITQGGNHEALLDDLWRWVSGDDPAVYVVRESDIAAIEVEQRGSQMVAWDVSASGPEQARRFAQDHLRRAAAHEAMARAFEAKQAVDSVAELASQIETATRQAVREAIDALGKSVDMQAVEDSILATVKEDSQWLANHVLGQEASSDE